jgi:hypothetical protein
VSAEQTFAYWPAGPVIAAFHASSAHVRAIRGPVGSGKTTACCAELIRRAREQAAAPDGVRRSRFAIIRNTQPQLESTTLRTFQELIPAQYCKVSMTAPITVRMQFGDLDAEFMFMALDNDQDVRKLLSLELTGAFVNEAREVPVAVIDQLTARVGRFPSARQGGCSWSGIAMDSNAPDVESWWYRFAEETRPSGWQFFSQPSGLAANAENLHNLNQTAESLKLTPTDPARLSRGRQYYERLIAGKSVDWVRVYVEGSYGFSLDGRPVFPEYSDSLHTAPEPMDVLPHLPMIIGLDPGLGGAAAVFLQRQGARWIAVHELVTENMGVESFARLLKMELVEVCPNQDVQLWIDPAGLQRSQVDERTPLGIFKNLGLPVRACPTNDLMVRLEAVRRPLGRLIEGKPAFVVCPNCTKLRKALSGGYHYRRIQVGGSDRYHDLPDKDAHSHVADALGYALLGGGEGAPDRSKYKRFEYSIT